MNKNSEAARKMFYNVDLRKRVVDYVENGDRMYRSSGRTFSGRKDNYISVAGSDRLYRLKRKKA